MPDTQRILVIDLRDTIAGSFLFNQDEDTCRLVKNRVYPKSLSEKDLTDIITYSYTREFDEIRVVGNRIEWLANTVKKLSADGFTLVIDIGGEKSYFVAAGFGRIYEQREYLWGIGKSLDESLRSENLLRIKNYLIAGGYSKDYGMVLDTMGMRKLYPSISGGLDKKAEDGLLALLAVILSQVQASIFSIGGSQIREGGGLRRIIVTGEFAHEIKSYAGVVLAVLNSLPINGVWQLVFDQFGVVGAFGGVIPQGYIELSDIGLVSLGMAIIPTHKYVWGEGIGEMGLDIGLSENQLLKLKAGQIVRVPLSGKTIGSLEFNVKKDVAIEMSSTDKLVGGELGLIIDVRGRPLPDFQNLEIYKKNFHHWQEALGI